MTNRAISTVFAVLAVALLTSATAHAFKLEDGSGNAGGKNLKADETSPFYGPKKYDTDTFKDSGNGVYKFGNSELRIGSQPNPAADYRQGVERMFNPLGRPDR